MELSIRIVPPLLTIHLEEMKRKIQLKSVTIIYSHHGQFLEAHGQRLL